MQDIVLQDISLHRERFILPRLNSRYLGRICSPVIHYCRMSSNKEWEISLVEQWICYPMRWNNRSRRSNIISLLIKHMSLKNSHFYSFPFDHEYDYFHEIISSSSLLLTELVHCIQCWRTSSTSFGHQCTRLLHSM